jgi:GH25 family lysozyme M1 (1,4-beta-N-acetylmuramidase)
VVYPDAPAKRQVDKIMQLLGDDHGDFPVTLDCELDRGQHFSKIAAVIFQCAVLLEDKTGKKPIIYSRANWIDVHITGTGNVPNWLNNYDYWLAQYLREPKEHPGPPNLPKGVSRDRVIIHQTSERGAPIGSQARQQDYNRWQGDLSSLYTYLGKTPPPGGDGEEPASQLTLEERIKRLEDAARQNGWQI